MSLFINPNLKKHEGNAYYKDEPKRFEEVGLA